jgi:DNA mismatch repair protein MutL
MSNQRKLKKLPQEVVNQIAAGEVIERPASVVKELVDNSIDAEATEITIKLRDGGISLVEVADNGIGIPEGDLAEVFTAHTTTKLESLDDLNTLMSMGFRGEALSTIVAVSDVSMTSKYEDEDIAHEVKFKSPDDYKVTGAAREAGTVVTVENIFENVPVRKKYLKTAQTEYRNILNTLTPYFMIYPNIHWELFKDGKKVIDLKRTSNKAGKIDRERVNEVVKQDFVERMESVFFDGNGMQISGLVAYPSDHMSRTKYQYIFVNGRHVWDNGIAKSVFQAYDRYIPHGKKVPFILNIQIKPELVDVNVHPRKEEVKFLNPYRVYSSVEQAVSKSIEKLVSYKNIPEKDSFEGVNKDYRKKLNHYEGGRRDINFSKGGSVKDSLKFSRAALQRTSQPSFFESIHKEDMDEKDLSEQAKEDVITFHQIFNKYIIVEFRESIWVIDQHAAAERITFEKLSKATEIENTDTQNLLVGTEIKVDDASGEFVKENIELFNNLGFNIDIKDGKLIIKSIPVEFVQADVEKLIKEVLELDTDELKKDLDRLKKDMVATMACHTSVRSGQKLNREEMKDLYMNLLECDNPYSCPHGRPIVWKMSIEEIDSKFDRTY